MIDTYTLSKALEAEASVSDTPHVCEHGQLARSCNICDLLFEIKELRSEISVLKESNERLTHEVQSLSSSLKNERAENLKLKAHLSAFGNAWIDYVNDCDEEQG